MTVTYHRDLVQGSDEWLAARRGMLTASEMCLILTPTLKQANNDKSRAHLWELLGQRITQYVEPHYISDDMLRGRQDELDARALYAEHYAPVDEVGFITNDKWGFTIGYSPDGLVGNDGVIECKSRRQKYQIETIASGLMPADYVLQVQTGLLVSDRAWCDFVSYSGGLPMVVLRVHADDAVQAAIVEAATAFEKRLAEEWQRYDAQVAANKWRATERRIEMEMFI